MAKLDFLWGFDECVAEITNANQEHPSTLLAEQLRIENG